MTLHPVRVTQEPGVVREVDDRELLDLGRQGLIHSFKHTAEAKAILSDIDLGDLPKWKPADSTGEVVTAPPAITDPAGSESTDTKGA